MSSITVKLRKGKGTSHQIYIHFNYGQKKQYRYATGLAIKKIEHWNFDSNTVKNVKAEPDSSNINADLADLLGDSSNLLRDLENGEIPIDNLLIKQKIKNLKEKKKAPKVSQYFLDHYKWFVEYYSKKPRPTSQKPLAKSTLKPYNNTKRIIEEYEEKIGIKLSFQHITLSFHTEFIQYLQDQEFSDNYIGTQIKNIKTVMHDAFERNLHKLNIPGKVDTLFRPKLDR